MPEIFAKILHFWRISSRVSNFVTKSRSNSDIKDKFEIQFTFFLFIKPDFWQVHILVVITLFVESLWCVSV